MRIMQCMRNKNLFVNNCISDEKNMELRKYLLKENKVEINKRFGMPLFIPLISLVSCFLLASRKDKKYFAIKKYLYFTIGFSLLIGSEISVRYSGISWNHTIIYYLIPVIFLPLIYFSLNFA